ncbi:MAG: T9SS C-terminal target domain-containing protein, partial [Chitinophagia bacterium]|nr:T9SS C-terminal target domain-containing protein [Chitinophagia bacterium]
AGFDDDFDTDNGYQGKNQFVVALRDPNQADYSGSKAFESDSYQSGTQGTSATGSTGTNDTTHLTKCVFSNVTAIGPINNPAYTGYNPYFVAGVHMRRGTGISILNSIIAGYPAGVLVDESSSSYTSTVANIGYNILQFRNNVIASTSNYYTTGLINRNVVFVKDGARSLTSTAAMADTTSSGTDWNALTGYAGPDSWLYSSANHNKVYTYTSDVHLNNPYNLTNPNFLPTTSSPLTSGTSRFPSWSASDVFNPALPLSYDTTSPATYNVPTFAPDFATNKAADGFFTNVNYVGAFDGLNNSATNWMSGWSNFDPNNENYDRVCYTTAISEVSARSFDRASVHPNPASENATLYVEIKKAGVVKATILDITGKVVKVIANEEVGVGAATFNFSTSEMSNGLYIMHIMADNAQLTIKFNVAK